MPAWSVSPHMRWWTCTLRWILYLLMMTHLRKIGRLGYQHIQGGITQININTATPQVIMVPFPKMTNVDAEVLIESRPYEQMNSLSNQSWIANGNLSRLSVFSDAFTLAAPPSFGRANVREEFLLSRTSQNTQLLSCKRLGWQLQ